MKTTITFLLTIILSLSLQGQSLVGAWEHTATTPEGTSRKTVVVFSDSHQVATVYDGVTGAFINTNGGSWTLENNTITEVVEFDSKKPERTGSKITFEVAVTDTTLNIIGSDQVFTRIDKGTPGALQGAWLMSGRIRDGKTQSRDTSKPRKTMKILSGTRFQWIAYNTETKEFKGTGGGTYSTVDGVYTENIEFFSRDNSRVGASLEFTYELKDGDWHHSGLSSKGAPIYEIWSVRK